MTGSHIAPAPVMRIQHGVTRVDTDQVGGYWNGSGKRRTVTCTRVMVIKVIPRGQAWD